MKIYSVKHESSVFLFRTGRSGAIVSNISFLFICILLDVDIGLRRWWIECVQKTNSPKLFHWKQMSVGWMESIEQGKHKRQNGRLRAPTHVSHYSHVFSDSINSIPPASHQPMKGTNDNVPHSFSAPAVAQRGPPHSFRADAVFIRQRGLDDLFLGHNTGASWSVIYGATGRRNWGLGC